MDILGSGVYERAEFKAQLAAKEAVIAELVGAVRDADHLCRWLLQSDISEEDRERVIRENGTNFALALAAPKEGL